SLLLLVLVVFCIRLRFLVVGTKNTDFSWYYFILYLCTVYVIPSVLLSKYYESHWLELLTP
ncbi:MAG: hypothetical protein ACKO68_03540, partial [Bacteroidota bacterium]